MNHFLSDSLKVTVVTCVRNAVAADRSDYLVQCIASVYNQTYSNVEHIVIDGASSDGTVAILEKCKKDYNIQYYSEPDDGMYFAMNKGILKAKGDFIIFLNSDDYFHNLSGIEESVNSLMHSGADIAFSKSFYLVEHDCVQCINAHPENVIVCMPFCHQSVFVRRTVLINENMFDTNFKSAADYDLILRIFLQGYKYVFADVPFVSFRYGGWSTVNEELSLKECKQVHKKIYGEEFEIKVHSYTEYDVSKKMLNKIFALVSNQFAADIKKLKITDIDEEFVKIETLPYSEPIGECELASFDRHRPKILLLYHNNIFECSGCNNYAKSVVEELRCKGFIVDFFGLTTIESNWDSFYERNNREKLFRNCFLYSEGMDIGAYTLNLNRDEDYGWFTADSLNYLQNVFNTSEYQYIYIHYTPMASCLRYCHYLPGCKKVYSFIDSMPQQHFFHNGMSEVIGSCFFNELAELSMFDFVMCVSHDEKIFYEKFLPDVDFSFLPSLLNTKDLNNKFSDIDVLFIGYRNKFNIDGMLWFIDEVLPYIKTRIRFGIAGIIGDELKTNYYKKYQLLALKTYLLHLGIVDDLDELYSRTKISICPLLEGTGIKIKVLDSMSRSIPVVGTERAIDGFPDKHDTGCLISNKPDKFAEYIDNLLQDSNQYVESSTMTAQYFKKYLSSDACKNVLCEVFCAKPSVAGALDSCANNSPSFDVSLSKIEGDILRLRQTLCNFGVNS